MNITNVSVCTACSYWIGFNFFPRQPCRGCRHQHRCHVNRVALDSSGRGRRGHSSDCRSRLCMKPIAIVNRVNDNRTLPVPVCSLMCNCGNHKENKPNYTQLMVFEYSWGQLAMLCQLAKILMKKKELGAASASMLSLYDLKIVLYSRPSIVQYKRMSRVNTLKHEFQFHKSTRSCYRGMGLDWPNF